MSNPDTWCNVCGLLQFHTTSGVTCPSGHGGAEGTLTNGYLTKAERDAAMRHQTITCDRCGQAGQTSSQLQEGWYHVQQYTISNETPKDAGSFDLCYACMKEWEGFMKGKTNEPIR